MVIKGILGYVMAILLRLQMIKMKLFREQLKLKLMIIILVQE